MVFFSLIELVSSYLMTQAERRSMLRQWSDTDYGITAQSHVTVGR